MLAQKQDGKIVQLQKKVKFDDDRLVESNHIPSFTFYRKFSKAATQF